MQIDIEGQVLDAAGEDIGAVEAVIVEPDSGQVTHVVVRSGALGTRSAVVLIECIESSDGSALRLNIGPDEFDDLPEFAQEVYVQPPVDVPPPAGFLPGSLFWPAGAAWAPTVEATVLNVPEGSADLVEDMPVQCADGDFGTLDEVVTSDAGRVSSLIVRSTGAERKAVPYDWVDRVEDGVIFLDRSHADADAGAELLG